MKFTMIDRITIQYKSKLSNIFNYTLNRYCKGGELFDEIIRRRWFSEEDAAYIMKQVLSAIAYCHENNIIHRDLKPENILIEDNPEDNKISVKVIDFGAS